MLLDCLNMILKGGRVARFHTRPTLKPETVAEHSYLVAWIATLFTGTPRAELLLACLAHDIPEYVMGDIPSPSKRAMGRKEAFKQEEDSLFAGAGMPNYEDQLTPEEREILKFSDNLAGYLKCLYERQLGNTLLHEAEMNYSRYLKEGIEDFEHLDKDRMRKLVAVVNGSTVK